MALAQCTFTTIDYPDAIGTGASKINASGQIVGLYGDASLNGHGFFLDSDGISYSTIDFPGSRYTEARGINASGQVVGLYEDASRINHGFFWGIATS